MTHLPDRAFRLRLIRGVFGVPSPHGTPIERHPVVIRTDAERTVFSFAALAASCGEAPDGLRRAAAIYSAGREIRGGRHRPGPKAIAALDGGAALEPGIEAFFLPVIEQILSEEGGIPADEAACRALVERAAAAAAVPDAAKVEALRRLPAVVARLASAVRYDLGPRAVGAVADGDEEAKAVQAAAAPRFPGLVGTSTSLLRALDVVEKAATAEISILLVGESGTGKELVARAIHERSHRRGGPFVAVNCAAIPEGLAESEFFGHERGAFTGAVVRRTGHFEAASGGTIFLDEVGDMDAALQAKLLRAIQEREVRRLGSARTLPIDVRIVAATNRDLEADVERGIFRRDLFYRLDEISIRLPALRERREDVPLLADHILRRVATESKRPIAAITPAALDALLAYDWPGNVREMENALKGAAIMSDGKIALAHLPERVQRAAAAAPAAAPLAEQVAAKEREAVLRALVETSWNVSRAAEALGVSRRTLQRKIAELGLADEVSKHR